MLRQAIILLLGVSIVLAGTLCPPREDIYPCICNNVPQAKRTMHTFVICHRIHDKEQLDGIFHRLKWMQIDQFHLYDSFWEAAKLGDAGLSKRVLPSDWFSLLRIKEMGIVDTALSPEFACQWTIGCIETKNVITTRFAAVNSTDRVSHLCDTGKGNKFPWTGCMPRLREFQLSQGRLVALGSDLFPLPMPELRLLNLTRNFISKVDSKALLKLPNLTHLDLSHNLIRNLSNFFGHEMTKLEFLDLSWNSIKEIGLSLMPLLPNMKTLMVQSNAIVNLKKDEFRRIPESLQVIDLSRNPLHCDCSMVWINSTVGPKVSLSGTCSSPERYRDSNLRRASKFLVQLCKKKTSKPPEISANVG